MSFIKHEYSDDVPVQFGDEDLAAWEVGAKRWARMLFLVVTEEKHLEPIFMFLLNHTHNFCQSLSIKDWIPLKLLILILSLIEELQLGWKKPIRSTKAKTCIEFEGAKILDKFSCPVTSISRERIIKPFVPILEDLVSFAKLVSPILWSTTMPMDSHSPCFVSGKLGGPSQRRLSPDTTSAVLQADVKENTVMIYMKGIPKAPQCGLCALAVKVLQQYGVPIGARNILEHAELKEGIKAFRMGVDDQWSYFEGNLKPAFKVRDMVFHKDKLYILGDRGKFDVYTFEPQPERIYSGCILKTVVKGHWLEQQLVQSGGDLLYVRRRHEEPYMLDLFKQEEEIGRWVSVRSLGDGVMLLGWQAQLICTQDLMGSGFERNCIYFPRNTSTKELVKFSLEDLSSQIIGIPFDQDAFEWIVPQTW